MRIAIVGSGIAGLTSAYLLNKKYDITLFESAERLGGHTATIDVQEGGRELAIDTGFIVYNDWTYPNFIKLMDQLGVESQPTDMGFSVCSDRESFEYAGNNLNSLFGQRSNLLSPGHWRMLRDILRFNREAVRDWQEVRLAEGMTLGQYLEQNSYSAEFCDRYLVPMGSAIWSASLSQMRDFSVDFFVRFFFNHGLLNIFNRPQWRVIKGGSREYIQPMVAGFEDRVRLSTPVKSVIRTAEGVELHTDSGERLQFDAVVFACHSDQALACLSDASEQERSILGAIPYAGNSVVLHTDTRLLPSRQRCWASWNYRLQESGDQLPVLTYNMNILQRLESEKTYCVTLNADDAIDPEKVIGRYEYAHPQFSVPGMRAQQEWEKVNGVNNTWYCGAYWANGFHEDGVKSALRVCEALGVTL
ncbi:FAD-dependent oxidoreductase [Microbulbifer flavimaris]|uniref:FAD-dependent oxidoreductase n=1 Tax=Microbulbifer flavimaris TaxID=1781068 RepID=A0ABX4I3I3_9GAMM|nr:MULTISPECIES: FAD-dependent oxidoreductase [Microbulbifer]KUJ84578.1 FAD-dependent oxidoreductase [Microbulbifer sp. ZGT114]PCO06666.1 FAD-dependent oxidoreductase [Microbulbifer flavimaris]